MTELKLSEQEKQIANLTAMLKEAQARPVAKEEPQAEEIKQDLGGTLEVEVVEAKLERSTEMWGKQDPFAELSIRLQKFKTKTHTDGAKAPVWNETATMDVLDPTEEMAVQVFDEDMTANDLICEGTVNLATLCLDTPVDAWFALHFDGKPSGSIHLRTKYTPRP